MCTFVVGGWIATYMYSYILYMVDRGIASYRHAQVVYIKVGQASPWMCIIEPPPWLPSKLVDAADLFPLHPHFIFFLLPSLPPALLSSTSRSLS